MDRSSIVGLLSVPLVLLLALNSLSVAAAEKGEGKKRRANTVLYQPKEDAGAKEKAALAAVLGKYGLQTSRKLVAGKVLQAEARHAQASSEEQWAAELVATGAVAFAEPDYLVAPVETPNDPYFSSQWHHATIDTPGAWNITHGSTSILVAICDTGVSDTHPDLAPNMQLPGFNAVDNSSNTSDTHGHGTRMAGCIGAVGNNGAGVAGVNWNVKILPVKISNAADGSAFYSDAAEAVRYAADRGAKAVSLSYEMGYTSTLDSAAQYLRQKGGLLFVAAGNDGADKSALPDYASLIVVGSSGSSDTKSGFSAYGTPIDLVSPGEGIYTTTPGDTYTTSSGTSPATPVAAGVAALVYSLKPTFTAAQVENFIFSSCVDLGAAGEDSVYGRGRVNAAGAVAAAAASLGQQAPSITSQPANQSVYAGQTATFSVGASGSAPLTYQWRKNGVNIQGATGTSYTTPATMQSDNGTLFSAVVSNTYGIVTSNNATLSVLTVNQSPVLQSSPWANPNPVTLPIATTSAVEAYDPDNGPAALTYTWSKVSGPGTVSFSPNGTTASNYSSTSFSVAGSYTLRVTISDGAANLNADLNVTVQSNPTAKVHVGGITMSLTSNPSGTRANARVVILDQGNAVRSGATVTGTWSGVVSGSSTGITGADGSVTLSSPKTKKSGTFTFTVTGVSLSGYTYDPSANTPNSASITKP